MADPGVVSAAIGISMQMLVNIMIEWIKSAACCEKELDKLKELLLKILPIYAEMQVHADRISSLSCAVYSWLTKLKDLLQKGSQFVKECTVPLPLWKISRRVRLTKEIARFTSELREHLDTASSIGLLHQLDLHAAALDALEQLRISASVSALLPASTSSPAPNPILEGDDILLQSCFLRLAAFSEDEVIHTASDATECWIREGLVAPDHLQTGQRYVNLLADFCLIQPLDTDDNGDVLLFMMRDDFHDLERQIVEEEKRCFRTVRDSQEFSGDERFNAGVEVRIKRGTNLAVRDRRSKSSDPYVVAILNDQKRKTGVRRKNLNPVWNEKFSLPLPQSQPLVLKLKVYDKDRLSRDDPMGYGEVDLNNLAKAARMRRTSTSPYSEMMNTEGIKCVDGYMVQEVCLKLQNVESGELYLDIKWVYRTN